MSQWGDIRDFLQIVADMMPLSRRERKLVGEAMRAGNLWELVEGDDYNDPACKRAYEYLYEETP